MGDSETDGSIYMQALNLKIINAKSVANCFSTKRTCSINAKQSKWPDVSTLAGSLSKAN